MALALERALALELLAEASKMMLLGDQLAPELHDGPLALEVLDDSPALELLLLLVADRHEDVGRDTVWRRYGRQDWPKL